MTTLYAQPYDITATGFFFETTEKYQEKSVKLRNSAGWPVEEFELQFIDGAGIDAKLFEALGVNQCNFPQFLEAVDGWNEDEKIKVIIAVGEVGYNFNLGTDTPDQFEIDLYATDSLKELAEQFVEEGLFGDIPERIRNYLDYDAIARDLGMDYSETTIDGKRYVYRCD